MLKRMLHVLTVDFREIDYSHCSINYLHLESNFVI